MTSIRVLVPVIALLFASVASAQSDYPQSYYSNSYSSPYSPSYSTYSTYGCVVLASDLSYGSRGTEVTKLQQFLVSQNYPGSGSWMVTGYYGTATTQAVRNFQQSAGLPVTGYVDWQTRTAIQTRSCGGYSGYPTYPSSPTYPTYPSSQCGYYSYGNYCEKPEIDRIRPTSGETGDKVTIEGSGFSPTGNQVFFDGRLVATVSSTDDGEELRFTVPSYFNQQQSYQYGNQYGNQYGYQYGQYGYNNNYWYPGYDRERIDEGTYDVTVRNAFGQTSNERTFRVTDNDNDDDDDNDDLSIEVLSGPSSLEEDEEGEWEVEIEAPDNRTYTVTADWDDGSTDVEAITGDETVTFEHDFNDEGDYDVEFKVSGHGESDTDTVRVEVEN